MAHVPDAYSLETKTTETPQIFDIEFNILHRFARYTGGALASAIRYKKTKLLPKKNTIKENAALTSRRRVQAVKSFFQHNITSLYVVTPTACERMA